MTMGLGGDESRGITFYESRVLLILPLGYMVFSRGRYFRVTGLCTHGYVPRLCTDIMYGGYVQTLGVSKRAESGEE